MAQYKVMWNDKYENFTYLGTVRQIVTGLEGEGFDVTVKRHFTNSDRVVYQTGKINKFGMCEKSEKARKAVKKFVAWAKAHQDAIELAIRDESEFQRKEEP